MTVIKKGIIVRLNQNYVYGGQIVPKVLFVGISVISWPTKDAAR